MTVACTLAILALFDSALAGFRALAGREGRIVKWTMFRGAIARGIAGGLLVLTANVAVVAVLVRASSTPDATWAAFVAGGSVCVWIFGAFATVTLAAMAIWLAPDAEARVLASIIVLGPLTLVRPAVIAAGLAVAAVSNDEPRVWVAAFVALVTMLGLEPVLGRAYRDRWRRLV